jgi:hypothetical protein
MIVAHECIPSYSGGRVREDHSLKVAQANHLWASNSEKTPQKQIDGVTQRGGSELDPSPQEKHLVTGGLFCRPLKGSVLPKCLCIYKWYGVYTDILFCVVWDWKITLNVILHMVNNRKLTFTYTLSWIFCVLWFLGVYYFNIIPQ